MTTENIGRMKGISPTPRDNPLVPGMRYVARNSLSPASESEQLVVGEVVVYEGSCYSWYDEASVFRFVTDSGERRSWYLSDSQPVESWKELLVPV